MVKKNNRKAIGIIGIILVIALLFFVGNQFFTVTLPSTGGYGFIGDSVTIAYDLSPSDVGESSTQVSSYRILGAYAIVEEGTSRDGEWQKILNDVKAFGSGTCNFFDAFGNCLGSLGDESPVGRSTTIRILQDRAVSSGGLKFNDKAPSGDIRNKFLTVPPFSGQFRTYKIYAFSCDVGLNKLDQWSCNVENVRRVVGIKKDFCGDLSGVPTPTDLIKTNSWDNYCFINFNPGYCDKGSHECIKLCQNCDADQYCLARHSSSGDKIRNVINAWNLNEDLGNLGCVDKDKVCQTSKDCVATGIISGNEFAGARCEKDSVPSWLNDVNSNIFTTGGKFGTCEPGCKLNSDCSDTLGNADDNRVFVDIVGSSIAGESWTCDIPQFSSIGDCRLNICNHDTDCWTLERTQMSECDSGSCQRITCSDDLDCWNAVVTGIGTYAYGCVQSQCQLKYTDVPDNYLTPELCDLSKGVPDSGNAWDVTDGTCKQKQVISSECTPTGSQTTIQSECTLAQGIPNEGNRYICVATQFSGKTFGSCTQVQIPVTEDCNQAESVGMSPEEYCMVNEGVSTLADGKKWDCADNGMCVLADAFCVEDKDCQIGIVGGTCVNNLCRYGLPPAVEPPKIVCGDGVCDATETEGNCKQDCRKYSTELKLLWILPILIALGIMLLVAYRGKRRTGIYSIMDFLIGFLFGAFIGGGVYLVMRYWLVFLLLGLLGGGLGIGIIFFIGGIPLLLFLIMRLFGRRRPRPSTRVDRFIPRR